MAEILKFIGPAASFDPDLTAVLGSVFDDAISRLDGRQSAIVRDVVASRIIMLASRGERDPDRLRNAALGVLHVAGDVDERPLVRSRTPSREVFLLLKGSRGIADK